MVELSSKYYKIGCLLAIWLVCTLSVFSCMAQAIMEQVDTIYDQYGRIIKIGEQKYCYDFVPDMEDLSEQAPAQRSNCNQEILRSSCESECQVTWADRDYGDYIGTNNSMVYYDFDSDGISEIITNASGESYSYWYVLKYNASKKGFDKIHECIYFGVHVDINIRLHDLDNDGNEELLVSNGSNVDIYNLPSLTLKNAISFNTSSIRNFKIGDVDDDGDIEILFGTGWDFYIANLATQNIELNFNYFISDYEIGNVDNDTHPELVCTDGKVYEIYANGNFLEEYDFPFSANFGRIKLKLHDIDNDGKEEAIIGFGILYAYDLELSSEKYSFATNGFESLLLEDIDLDGNVEILVGDSQWEGIHCLNSTTGALKYKIDNPDHGVDAMIYGQFDDDLDNDLIWTSGGGTSGADFIHVYNARTRNRKFSTKHIDGPYHDIEIADVNGDGRLEIIALSEDANDGYGVGVLKIYDYETKELLIQSDQTFFDDAFRGFYSFELIDYGNDGDLEIILHNSVNFKQEFWVLDAETLVQEFTSREDKYDNLNDLQQEDIDGDGRKELISLASDGVLVMDVSDFSILYNIPPPNNSFGRLRLQHFDNNGIRDLFITDNQDLYILDLVTGDTIKHFEINNYFDYATAFDFDQDGIRELIVVNNGKLDFRDPSSGDILNTILIDCVNYHNLDFNTIKMVDLNDNGLPELLIFFENIVVHINECLGVEYREFPSSFFAAENSIILRDLDNDGQLNFVAGTDLGVAEYDLSCFQCIDFDARLLPADDNCDNLAIVNTIVSDPSTSFEIIGEGTIFKDSIELSPGIYDIIATNAAGCTKEIVFELLENIFEVELSIEEPVSCNGNDAVVFVSVMDGSPPYSYLWSNNATSDTIKNLSASNYSVTITDANGCKKMDSVEVEEAQIEGNLLLSTWYTCENENRGEASFVAPDISLLTYFWDGIQGNSINNSLGAGMHTLVVVDQKNCEWPFDFEVLALEIEAAIMQTTPSCALDPNGSAEVNMLKGNPPYMYSWSAGGSSSALLENVPAGIYTVTVTDGILCSTTAMIEIEQRDLEIVNLSESICYEDSYSYLDSTWSSPGIYQYPINDCDSILMLDLSVREEASSMVERSICEGDSVELLGQFYSVPDDYALMTTNQYGCDSMVAFSLMVTDKIEIYESVSICEGDSILVFGNYEMTAGTLSESYVTSSGCDSTQFYDISLEQIPTADIQETICEGDSIFIADTWFKAEGNYELIKPSNGLCDSIIMINIDQIDLTNLYDSLRVCEGDSLELYGEWIKEAGDYEYLVDNMPCKDRLQIKVELDPTETSSETIFLCPGDSILINNSWISQDTTLQELFTSIKGCDSLAYTEVVVYEYPAPPSLNIDCEEMMVLASVSTSSDWSILWSNGDSSDSTVYDMEGQGSILFSASPDCIVNYEIIIPALPDPRVLNQIEDKTINSNQTVMIDLDLSDEYQIIWSPAEIVDCETCSTVTLSPVSTTNIEATITHVSGCIYSQNFILNISEEFSVYIPNAFSPNDDDINERFKAYLPDGLAINVVHFHIYDRWGELIYSIENLSSDHPKMGWDGTFKGEPVIPGVYLYDILLDAGEQGNLSRTGSLSVIK